MAIKGVSKKPIPYVPEEDRDSPEHEQTVFWIKPKTGQDANESMRRYASAGREGRKGYRELNTSRLNNADLEEFLSIVQRVENFYFSEENPEGYSAGLAKDISDEKGLIAVCKDLPSDILLEVFDVANSQSKLEAGSKKGYASSHTSPIGNLKNESE